MCIHIYIYIYIYIYICTPAPTYASNYILAPVSKILCRFGRVPPPRSVLL